MHWHARSGQHTIEQNIWHVTMSPANRKITETEMPPHTKSFIVSHLSWEKTSAPAVSTQEATSSVN